MVIVSSYRYVCTFCERLDRLDHKIIRILSQTRGECELAISLHQVEDGLLQRQRPPLLHRNDALPHEVHVEELHLLIN